MKESMNKKKSVFKFKNPVIRKLCFEINETLDSSIKEREQNINISMNITGYKTPSIAILSLTINGKKDGKIPKNALYYMNVEIMGVFESDEELEEDEIKGFMDINAQALLLSYVRPLVASTLVQAGLPPYHIPFVNFTSGQKNR